MYFLILILILNNLKYLYKLPPKRGYIKVINKERFKRVKLINYDGFNIKTSNDKYIIFTLSPKFIRAIKLLKINCNPNQLEKDLIYLIDNSKKIDENLNLGPSGLEFYEYETYDDKLNKHKHFKVFQTCQNNLIKNKYKS